MDTTKMDHMKQRWFARRRTDVCMWTIYAEDGTSVPWIIANICGGLPGDDTGELTAKRICEVHNALIGASNNKGETK